jgi:flagellar motor switch/type III secretory pathway protein FliN
MGWGAVKEKDSGVNALPLRVVFQVAQIELTVGEVGRLAPGVIVPIDRSADDLLDIIVNGRRIGTGELVTSGGSLAVRVTRLSGDG